MTLPHLASIFTTKTARGNHPGTTPGSRPVTVHRMEPLQSRDGGRWAAGHPSPRALRVWVARARYSASDSSQKSDKK